LVDLIKLSSTRQSSGSTADDCNLSTSVVLRQVSHHQSVTPRVVYDGVLYVLDSHRRLIDSQHTRTLHTDMICTGEPANNVIGK